MRRRSSLLTLALVAGLVYFVPGAGVAADSPESEATNHLRQDAEAGITLTRGEDGKVSFVGTTAKSVIDNPEVGAGDSLRTAAGEHLDRYGAALEAAPGSTFAPASTLRTTSGVDLVRYQQEIDGVRVLGGEVVLGLASNRELRSITSAVSDAAGAVTGAARIAPTEAARTAREAVNRGSGGGSLQVKDQGRWVLDPAVAGLDLPGGARTVRRFEVADGAAIRELVLIDDRSGAVAYRTSLIAKGDADRVVCNRNNIRGAETACTSGFARTETGPVSAVPDVNAAFDHAGETAALYEQLAPSQYADLTDLLGVDVGGVKKLAATVKYCALATGSCPYANAFWNGQQMFYGNGFAAADDVVGHEITHGYTERTSGLFYWGQSGAINESMSDVIGEIIDHRNGADDDSAWDAGEDLAGGPLRRMSDPITHGDPDSMTSPLYDADINVSDNGGVHSNSGVGNKTAYLISQGTGAGGFNGQTFTGIDGGDTTLAKTALLYLEVVPRLVAVSDYADLGATLDQTCQDLRAQGTVRGVTFTAADCARVHQATLATALTSQPSTITKSPNAPTACQTGTTKRVLFSSEGPDATSAMTADAPHANPSDSGDVVSWSREAAGTLFRSDVWAVPDVGFAAANDLKVAEPVPVPLGQATYLSFRGWWVNEYVPAGQTDAGDYDGGAVTIDTSGLGVVTPSSSDWVNGPNGVLTNLYDNPHAGTTAFTQDSHGWVGSRLDLSSYGGQSVRPQFTMLTDSAVGFYGWFLDDVTVYTCDPVPGAVASVSVTGSVGTATVRWTPPTQNPGAVTGYWVSAGVGRSAQVSATARSVQLRGLGVGAQRFTVQATGINGYLAPVRSVRAAGTSSTLTVTRKGAKVTFTGQLKKDGVRFVGRRVLLERKIGSSWVIFGTATTNSKGIFVKKVRRPAKTTYRARYLGETGVMGALSSVRRR